jgi:hypothetical protein
VKKLAKISLVALLVAIVIVGCVKVTVKLDLTTTSLEFTLGTTPTGQINATVNPADATINYTSENTGIATVNSSGLVTAVAAGNTRIEVQGTKDGANPKKKYVDVTVNPQPQVEFTVETTPDPLSLVMGSGSGALSISGPSGAEYDLVAPDCVNLEYVSETEYVVVPVAAGSGEIVITGTLLGNLPKTVRIPVTVAEMPVVGVTVEPDEIEFTIVKADNDPVQLNVTTNPADAVVSYESSDNSVATVDADGLVTLAETADEGDFCVITVTGEKTGYTDGSDQVIVYVGAIHTPVVKKAEWLMKPFMIKTVGAMACEWQPTLNLQLQFFDADDDIVIGSVEIVNPDGEIVEEIALTENFYLPTTYVIDVADLDNVYGELVGGTYEAIIGVIDADGLTAETTLIFQVMADPFEVAGVGFADGSAIQYDGSCVVITENPILELDIWFDSKVSVNVALYNSLGLVDEMDFDLYANEWGLYTKELDLSEILPYISGDGSEYLIVTVDVPETCCIYPVELELCDGIYFDKTPELECGVTGSPCGSTCDICEGYKLFVNVTNLLFEDVDFIDEIGLTINGVEITGDFVITEIPDGFNVEFEMLCGEYGDILNEYEPTPFTWDITTVTGASTEVTCDAFLDCEPPMFEFIGYDCVSLDDLVAWNYKLPMDIVINDNSGLLQRVELPIITSGSAYASLEVANSGDYPILSAEGIPTPYTIEATLSVVPVAISDTEATVTIGFGPEGGAEDINCLVGTGSHSVYFDTTAPVVYFGQACGDSFDCVIPCYEETAVLQWLVIDSGEVLIELEVSPNSYLGDVEGTTSIFMSDKDGQILWNFPDLGCDNITATMTVIDECGNETVESIGAYIDNIPPEIVVFETDIIEDGCGATETTLIWCVDDCSYDGDYEDIENSCGPEWEGEPFLIAVRVEDGHLFDNSNKNIFIDSVSDACGITYFSTHTSIDAGDVSWIFEDEMSCEYLEAELLALDTCAWKEYCDEDWPYCGIWEEITGLFHPNNYDFEYLQGDVIINNWDFEESSDFYFYCPLPMSPYYENCGTQRMLIDFWIGPMIDAKCIEPENVEIVTNYPYVPCGVDVEGVPGEYHYSVLDLLDWNIADDESSLMASVDYSLQERDCEDEWWLEGFLYFCLPKIDCETFEATLVFDDNCGNTWELENEVSDDDLYIDNVSPELGVEIEGQQTCDSTGVVFTITATDNSFKAMPMTDPATILVEKGTVSSGYSSCEDGVYTGTFTWLFGDINCEDLTATVSVRDICCEDSIYCCDKSLDTEEVILFEGVDNVSPTGEATILGDGVVYCVDQIATTAATVLIEWCVENAEEVFVEVSDGVLEDMVNLDTYDSTTSIYDWGSLIWNLNGVSDKDVFATVTALDECGNCAPLFDVVATKTMYIDNSAPAITVEFEEEPNYCEDTSVNLLITITDPNLVCNELCSTDYHIGDVTTNFGTLTENEIWAECGCGGSVTFETLWEFGNLDGEELVATVTAWDRPGNIGVETLYSSETVDNVPPVINSFSAVISGTELKFCWDATDTNFSNMTIDYSVDGGSSEKYMSLDAIGCVTFDVPNENSTVVATATAFDAQPCCHETSVNNEPPVVVDFDFDSGDDEVVVTFDMDMDSDTSGVTARYRYQHYESWNWVWSSWEDFTTIDVAGNVVTLSGPTIQSGILYRNNQIEIGGFKGSITGEALPLTTLTD